MQSFDDTGLAGDTPDTSAPAFVTVSIEIGGIRRPVVITPRRLELWLRCSRPGDQLVYAEAESLSRDIAMAGSRVPALAREAYRAGLVHLVQRRLGPGFFAYVAVRRNPPPPWCLPLKMVGDDLPGTVAVNRGRPEYSRAVPA